MGVGEFYVGLIFKKISLHVSISLDETHFLENYLKCYLQSMILRGISLLKLILESQVVKACHLV